MLLMICLLFALSAVFGLLILKNWLTGASTSKTIVYAHGLFAAAALISLVIYILKNDSTPLRVSLTLFVVAAMAGFYMFARDLKGKFSPVWLAVIHGLVAVSGFTVILLQLI